MNLRSGLALVACTALMGTTPDAVASLDGPTHSEPSPAHGRAMTHDHQVHGTRVGVGRLRHIRRATARFHNIATAESAGYVLLKDLEGITCIAMPGAGGMGVHYVKPQLIANPAIRPGAPEALVYAPDRDGTLRLAALEFLVDKSAWDAGHSAPPRLFRGSPFDLTAAGNRFGLDPFYSQHVWAWKHNPAGLLSMWNPAVHCSWTSGKAATNASGAGTTRTGRGLVIRRPVAAR